ncbi:MAG: outer membrane lipoprotein-sorting protein [Acidobacteria bacterium]|nr:outer membrane lipoprotein-sorting protein [Acidobacteriota bacterium]
MNRSLTALALVAALASPAIVQAQDAREIMLEQQRRTDAKSQRWEGLLQVFDASGKVSDKRWVFERLGAHGGSKSLLTFVAPPDVKGVMLLVLSYPDRASDQWMWIPANERERRVALQDRATRFFGTDFTFEDLEERDVEQYSYSMVGDEAIDGVACWKIESRPKQAKASQYTRSYIWVRKDNYAFQQFENYIKKELVRRLKYSRIEQVQGIWSARMAEMTDFRRNSRTVLTFEKLLYNTPMNEEGFTVQALRRGK